MKFESFKKWNLIGIPFDLNDIPNVKQYPLIYVIFSHFRIDIVKRIKKGIFFCDYAVRHNVHHTFNRHNENSLIKICFILQFQDWKTHDS